MGLSVISSLPMGINAAATSQNSPFMENVPGIFAGLLSRDLPGTGGLIAELSGNALNTTRLAKNPKQAILEDGGTATSSQNSSQSKSLPSDSVVMLAAELFDSERLAAILSGKSLASTKPEEDPKQSIEELLGDTTNLLDPSMIASLTGNPALPQEIQLRGAISSQIDVETLEKRITELNSGAEGILERSGAGNPKTGGTESLGIFDKLMSAAQRPGQSGTLGNEAARSAAEATITPEMNNTVLTGTIDTNTSRQSREALAADQSSIHTPFRDSSWSQQFGEKMVWLAKNDQQSAQININPPDLGPVQITLNLSGDQAKLAFASPHAEVRQAIENALPQLKEMLSSAGINLGQTNVGANMTQQNPDNPYQAANGKHLPDENAILPANEKALSTSTSSVLQRGRGLVDLFA